MQQAITFYRLPLAPVTILVSSPLAVQAFCAGQMAYRQKRACEDIERDIQGSDLPEVPTDIQFTAYFQAHLSPVEFEPEEEAEWRAYFMAGWYSRFLCIG